VKAPQVARVQVARVKAPHLQLVQPTHLCPAPHMTKYPPPHITGTHLCNALTCGAHSLVKTTPHSLVRTSWQSGQGWHMLDATSAVLGLRHPMSLLGIHSRSLPPPSPCPPLRPPPRPPRLRWASTMFPLLRWSLSARAGPYVWGGGDGGREGDGESKEGGGATAQEKIARGCARGEALPTARQTLNPKPQTLKQEHGRRPLGGILLQGARS